MNKNSSQIVISKKTLIIALIVVLLLIAGVVAWALGAGARSEKEPANGAATEMLSKLEIDAGASVWDGQQLPDKTPDAPAVGIKIPGYPSITLPADRETVNVALINPEGNPCYFTFEIVLTDSGESLYQSKLVPPGNAITEITMSKSLPVGNYNATIKVTTTSLADGTAMNGANVETVLIVK